jgi:hypothetical protein
MYSGRIQILAIAGSVLLAVFILVLIRKRRLKEEYSLLWLFFSFVFLVLSIWRGSIDWIASVVGVAYAPAALFLILLMAIFMIMIEFSLIISQIADVNKHLAQDVGILKEELEELKEELNTEIKKNKSNPDKDSFKRAADNT